MLKMKSGQVIPYTDICNYLFNRLRDRNIYPIILRLLINMYINQKIEVKWNNVLSNNTYYFFLMYIIVLCLFHRMLLYVYYIGLLKRFRV